MIPSPDAENISFFSNITKKIELYIYNIVNKSITQLTQDKFAVPPYYNNIWTNDSNNILYCKDTVGKEKFNIFKIDIKTKKITQLTDTPNNQNILGQVNHKNNEIAFFSDRTGRTQIFTMDLDGGNAIQRTNFKGVMFGRRAVFRWVNLKYSVDDSVIYFTANDTTKQKNFSIFKLDLPTNTISKILSLSEDSNELLSNVSEDGKFILFSSDMSGRDRIGLFEIQTKQTIWISSGKFDEVPCYFTLDNNFIVSQRKVEADQKIIIYDIKTNEERVLPLEGYNTSYFPFDKKKLMLYHTDTTHNGEVYLLDLQTNKSELILPADYNGYSPERDFYPDEYVAYPSTDDTIIHAILIKPRKLDPGKKYPAIISIHGGPTAQVFRTFDPVRQFIVDNGYILMLPNNRGSTGYGAEFRDAIINDWGGKDLDDVVAGVKYLQQLGYIDKEKIGIEGGSYGGFMTYRALTKIPKLFKAGCAINGITDLVLNYETAKESFPWIGKIFEMNMGNPDHKETYDLWVERSPITLAHQLESYLLVIHAENDPRCTINQIEAFRNKLIDHKKDYLIEMIVLKDQGHSGSIEDWVTMAKSEVDFFDKYLKN